MIKSLKILRMALLVAIISAAAMFTACSNNNTNLTETDPDILYEGKTVAQISTTIAYMPLEEMTAKSELVVVGKVVDKKEFIINPTDDRAKIKCVDYYVEATEKLRGKAVSNPITVRVTGDYVFADPDIKIVYSDDQLSLNVGEEYLLILTQPGLGGGYNTKGDYYYIQNCNTGAYQKGSKDSDLYTRVLNDLDLVSTTDQKDVSIEEGTILDYAAYVKMVNEINERTPVDPSHHEKELMENLKGNIGIVLSQEGYDEAMKELNEYATIIEYPTTKE